MCRIENDAIACITHPVERPHVGNEIIIPKRGAALGETKLCVAEGNQFLGDVSHIPWRKELAFFYIDRTARFRSSTQKIRLPAEKCGNLQHVDLLAGNLGF